VLGFSLDLHAAHLDPSVKWPARKGTMSSEHSGTRWLHRSPSPEIRSVPSGDYMLP
jgi:hypothetical protein